VPVARGYDPEFFGDQEAFAIGSEVVLPLVVGWLQPRSVVDVGCGVGAWSRTAMDLGVEDVVGVDGGYVPKGRLKIPTHSFVEHDLETRLELHRSFDLVLCLEVAEHLPPERAGSFVQDLARLSNAILFSAAIPRQRGTNHRNERWQSYWATLFARHRFELFDVIRSRIWYDDRVAPYYRQNAFLYAREAAAEALKEVPVEPVLDCAHPNLWLGKTVTPRDMIRLAPRALRESVRYHLRGMRRR
jgi:SAM-dependent methyltransferase